MKARERNGRDPVAALEDHVSMEVPEVIAPRGVLVADEGRESTGIVEPVGSLDGVLPGRPGDV